MSEDLTFRPVLIETGSADEDGRLVFARDRLIAVLVRLSAATHPSERLRGKWFLEAGFGPCAMHESDVFPALAEAEAWIRGCLAARPRPGPARGA